MIKTFENFNEIDPWGEEDWEESNIEVGDTVICIDNSGTELKKGEEHVVMKFLDSAEKLLGINAPSPYKLKGLDQDRIHYYKAIRFKKKKL